MSAHQFLYLLEKGQKNSVTLRESFLVYENERPAYKGDESRMEKARRLKREAREDAKREGVDQRKTDGEAVAQEQIEKTPFEGLTDQQLNAHGLKVATENNVAALRDFLEHCSDKDFQRMNPKTAESLINVRHKFEKKYYDKMITNLSFETKKELIVTNTLGKDLSNVLYRTLKPEERAVVKRLAQEKQTKEVETRSMEEFKTKKLSEKIKQSLDGVKITKTRITFDVDGVTRSFSIKETKKNIAALTQLNQDLSNAKTIEEVRLLCYKYLDQDSEKSTKGRFEKSNEALTAEIAKLEGKESGAAAQRPLGESAVEGGKSILSPKELTEKTREYTIQNLFRKVLEIYPKAHVSLEGVELKIQIAGYPTMHLYPELDATGKIRNLHLSVERHFVGDEITRTLKPEVSNVELKKVIEKEKVEFDEDVNTHREFVNIPAEGEIPDMGRAFKISDKKIRELANDDKNWSKEFHNLAGHAIYTTAFKEYFNVPHETGVAKKMLNLLQEGKNDRLYFNDLLTATSAYTKGSKEFEKNFRKLQQELQNPNLNLGQRERKTSEFRGMYDTYLGAMKILKTLETDTYAPAREEAQSETYRSKIEQLPVASESEKAITGTYWNFDELNQDQLPTANTGKVQISISSNAYNKFNEVWKTINKNDNDFDTTRLNEIIKVVFSTYRTEELLTIAKAVNKAPEQEKGTTKLVLTDIPRNFNADNPKVEELIKNLQTGKKKSAYGKLRETQKSLSRSEETYVQYLRNALKTDQEEITTDTDEAGYKEDLQLYGSVEALSREIFSQPKVVITDEHGQREITLYTKENGVKKIYPTALKQYLNYLIWIGLAKQERDKVFKERNAKKKTPSNFDQQYSNLKLPTGEGSTHLLDLKITKEQAAIIREGLAAKEIREKALEGLGEEAALSSNPKIAEIQKLAIDNNYPAAKIGEIESKIIAGGFLQIKGDEIAGGGLAFQIPLGNKFSLILEGHGGASGGGGGVALSYRLIQSDKVSASVAIGAGVGIGKYHGDIKVAPAIFLGYVMQGQIGNSNLDLMFGVGGIASFVPAISAGVGLVYNEGRATRKASERIKREVGFDKIEASTSASAKATIIRELTKQEGTIWNQAFGEIESKLDDADLLSIYESWSAMGEKEAFEKGKPAIFIDGFGAGVAVIPVPPYVVPFGGIRIRVGSKVVVKPRIGERAAMAEKVSETKIQAQLAGKETSGNLKFYDRESPSLILGGDGQLMAVREDKASKKIKEQGRNLAKLNENLQTADTGIQFATRHVRIGEDHPGVLEFTLTEIPTEKDLAVYIDPDSNLNAIVHNGRILIPGNPKNLTIVRETFKYTYRQPNGALSKDVIVISDNPNFNFDRTNIFKESRALIEKNWQDGKHTAFRIVQGYNKGAAENIHEFGKYQQDTSRWQFEDHQKSEEAAQQAADKLPSIDRRSHEKLKVREKFEETAKSLYEKMRKELHAGKTIRIDDPKSVIQKANEVLQSQNQEKLNPKEASQFYSLVQHLYFVNLWKKGGKNEVLRAFDKNNIWLKKHVMIPQFEKAILQLGIKQDARQAHEYATQLVEQIMTQARENFVANLDSDTSGKAYLKQMTAINPELSFYSGTTVRSSGEGTFSRAIRGEEMPGIPKMGLVGTPREWQLNAADNPGRDIAKIIYHITNPSVNIEKPSFNGLHRLAQKLLHTPDVTTKVIGLENYQLVVKAYTEKAETVSPETLSALKVFARFTEKVKAEMLNPDGYKKVTTKGGKELYLKTIDFDGVKLTLEMPNIYSGNYGQCGNISLLSGEGFAEEEGDFRAVRTVSKIRPTAELKKSVYHITLGASFTPEEEPTIPPEKRGKQVADTDTNQRANPDDTFTAPADESKGSPGGENVGGNVGPER